MTTTDASYTGPPEILEHDLKKYFPELLKFNSTLEMEASVLYKEIRREVEAVMNAVVIEELSPRTGSMPLSDGDNTIRALAWNLERGTRFDGIVAALKNNEKLNNKDVLLLTELDHGMARSDNRFVAR